MRVYIYMHLPQASTIYHSDRIMHYLDSTSDKKKAFYTDAAIYKIFCSELYPTNTSLSAKAYWHAFASRGSVTQTQKRLPS